MAAESIGRAAPDFEGWTCPLPLRDSPTVVMGHGGGGAMSAELVEHLFVPAFGDGTARRARRLGRPRPRRRAAGVLDRLVRGPAAVLPRRQHRRPRGQRHRQRPGDERRRAAVPLRRLHPRGGRRDRPGRRRGRDGLGAAAARGRASRSSPATPRSSSAATATGSTSTPPGSALVPDGRRHPARPRAAPATWSSSAATIGVHGVAIMSVREGLEFGTEIRQRLRSRCTASSRRCSPSPADLHVLRDPTRGGLATSLNEIAAASGVGVALDERAAAGPRRGRGRLRDARARPAVRGQRGQAGRLRAARATPTRCWRRCARIRPARGAVRDRGVRRGAPGDGRRPAPGFGADARGRPARRRAAAADLLTRLPARVERVGATIGPRQGRPSHSSVWPGGVTHDQEATGGGRRRRRIRHSAAGPRPEGLHQERVG